MSLKGKYTVKQLLNMGTDDFDKLTEKELRMATRVLADAGNKRLKRIEQADLQSNAYDYIKGKTGKGNFTTVGMDLNALRSEFIRAKGFLEAKTGNVRGARQVQEETIKTLGESGIEVKKKDYKKLWKTYGELKKRDASVANKNMKYKVLTEINQMLTKGKRKSVKTIVKNIENRLDEIYEKGEEIENDMGTSNAFEVD